MALLDIFRRADKEPVFVRNAEEWRMTAQDRETHIVGEPQATEWYTQARLKSDGIVGLYKPARRGLW
jgi:hypothetical protein